MKLPNLKNKELAEFVGILLGDGSINRSYQNRIQITLNKKEIGYRKYVVNLIHMLFDIEPKVRFRKNENTIDILIFKRKMIDFLIDEIGLK